MGLKFIKLNKVCLYAGLIFLTPNLSNASCENALIFAETSKVNEEFFLKEQGYSPNQYKGINDTEYIIFFGSALREKLKKIQADPYETHIDELTPFIFSHLEYIKQGFENPVFEFSKEEQAKHYRSLEKEALQRIQNKQVTYSWWLFFNAIAAHSLSLNYFQNPDLFTTEFLEVTVKNIKNTDLTVDILAAEDSLEGLLEHLESVEYQEALEDLHKIIESFPEKIVLPVIFEPGILALNKIPSGEQVMPIQLTNHPIAYDGLSAESTSPFDFFTHDLLHVVSGWGDPILPKRSKNFHVVSGWEDPILPKRSKNFHVVSGWEDPILPKRSKNFHNNFMLNLREASPQERLKAEAIYFILTHEVPREVYDRKRGLTKIRRKDSMKKKLRKVLNYQVREESAMPIFVELGLLQELPKNASEAEQSKYMEDYENLLKESFNIFIKLTKKPK